jgi:hypothetical protein
MFEARSVAERLFDVKRPCKRPRMRAMEASIVAQPKSSIFPRFLDLLDVFFDPMLVVGAR